MASRPGRQQPFRFWFPYWSGQPPQRPPQRPVPPRPPTSTPSQPPTQPQAQPKPPSPSRDGSPSQLAPPPQPQQSPPPSTQRAPRAAPPSPVSSPSPSPRSFEAPQVSPSPAAIQSRSPLQPRQTDSKEQSRTPTASRSPSPLQGVSKAQPVTKEVTQPPSQGLTPPSQAESPKTEPQPPATQPISQPKPKPQDSWPPAEDKATPLSPRDLQPRAQLQTSSQTEIPDQTQTSKVSPPTEATSQSTQDAEPKPVAASTSDIPHATQQPESKIKPEEIKEEKPLTSLETKQPTQPSQLPQVEEKPRHLPEDKNKLEPELKQTMTPTKQMESQIVKGTTDAEPKQQTQQLEKTPSGVSEETTKRVETPDSSPTRSRSDTRELMTETRISGPRQPEKQADDRKKGGVQNGYNGKESHIAISAIPREALSDGERGTFHTELKDGISKLVQKLNIRQPQQPGNGNAVTIITLAGENKGASMILGYETMDGKDKETRTNNRNDGSHRGKQVQTDHGNEAITANINSNVQSINNSLLHESSCNEKDPGVHLVYSSKPTSPVQLRGKLESHETFKTASSTTPAQKQTYEPNIRRRCLRALFLESSEDGQEKPQKPRRHGCRFSCDEKGKADLDGNSSIQSNTKHGEEGTSRAKNNV